MPDPDSRWYLPMHNAGMEMLKQKMWQNLGVDYTPGYMHMDDSQTYDDRKRGVIQQGKPDASSLQYYQQQMEKEQMHPMIEKLDSTPQPTALHPMAAALQGQQDPSMSGLFGVPQPKLQQMAGDVIRPPLSMFIPQKDEAFDVMYDDALQGALSGGFRNPANAAAIAKGVMGGNIKILNPAGK